MVIALWGGRKVLEELNEEWWAGPGGHGGPQYPPHSGWSGGMYLGFLRPVQEELGERGARSAGAGSCLYGAE